MAMEESKVTKMKQFIIEEKFIGYANIYIEAETKEEALALYNRGEYSDYDYERDDMTYDHEFIGITAEDEIVEPTQEVFQ